MNEKIGEIKKTLAGDWSMETLEVWRRAGYKCEYCGKDMRQCSDVYYFDSHIDHVDPDREDRNHIDNLALACKACNIIKRRRPCDPTLPREKIIDAVANFLKSVREKNNGRLAKDRVLLDSLDEIDPVVPRK